MAVSQRKTNEIHFMREDIYSGNLLLVNGTYPLRRIQTRQLISFDPGFPNVLLKRDAAHVLQMILDQIGAGDRIIPVSGYRSAEEQAEIYGDSQKENGEEFTRKFVALPYHSEHQTGLAIDLGLNAEQIDFLCPDFPYEGICQRFRQAAPEYGFIQRYEEDKEPITGIAHEPWHFRYVGYPHSRIMAEKGLALEEYITWIRNYREDCPYVYRQETGMEIRIYSVPVKTEAAAVSEQVMKSGVMCMGDTGRRANGSLLTDASGMEYVIPVPENAVYQISGNNVDGFIVTIWRV